MSVRADYVPDRGPAPIRHGRTVISLAPPDREADLSERPLIIGFEDTPEGSDALALGGQLAEALGARPLIVGAAAVPHEVLSVAEAKAALEAMTAGRLKEPARRLSHLDAEAESVASTSAARGLHELAESRSAVAVVVGSSGRGVMGRLVPGTTAERLLHGSPCPVAVAARGYAADEIRPLRVAVAYDGSPEAALALEAGTSVARRWNSTLTLLTVVVAASAYYAPAAGSTLSIAELERSHERQARERLDKGVARVAPDLPAHGQLLHGAPGEALVEVSEDYDLIIVGSRSYGPLRRTLLGSTSRRLFNASHCSVLATPRGSEPLAEDDVEPGESPVAAPS